MKRLLFITISLLTITYTQAQTAPPADAVTIQQNLAGLSTLGSVLYVAAHPDDENTRLLAWLARGMHYRTGYLSLTRGDGGQNLIGNEQSEQLGLIRTQELLAARRVDGAEQFFTRANDFGFSKNPEETLKIWDKEKILGDVVWVIRKFRPDVMICRFPTTGEGGHGHHTSSAILAQEAFTAAADPKRFPEQLKYVQVWQAKRLLWNTFNFGGTNTTSPDQLKIDVGGYNVLMGESYGEIAAESRSNHKSQGFGASRQRGEWFEYFKTIKGNVPQNSLLEGINTTWARVKSSAGISNDIAAIQKAFDAQHPEKSVPALVALLDKVEKIDDTYWREQKTKQVKDLIAACAGLWFESYAAQPSYAVGEDINIDNQIINRNNAGIPNVVVNSGAQTSRALTGTDNFAISNKNLTSLNTASRKGEYVHIILPLTQPYWLASAHGIGMYTLPSDTLAGNPENPNYPKTAFTFDINGKKVTYHRPIVYKFTDPVRGEVYQPIEITPPVTANIENPVYLFKGGQPQTVRVKLRAFSNKAGSISIKPVAGWKVSPEKIDFSGKNKGDEWTVAFTITPANSNPTVATLEAQVDVDGKQWSLGYKQIKYEHIPNITLFPSSQAKLVNLDLKTNGKNIGYINGAGDKVAESLRQIGYVVNILDEDAVLNGNLSVYDAIVVGVRAYNTNERMALQQPALLEYVKNGGNLVVQYNTAGHLLLDNIGPYPFSVVNQRVTEEDAKVTFADASSAILNYPNKITQADFNGWVQERGLYFASGIDSKYSTPLLMNDTGMAPNNGSLLVADYGKGRFVYTSLAFFRELPAGVPGAYRLFVNLLSKPVK